MIACSAVSCVGDEATELVDRCAEMGMSELESLFTLRVFLMSWGRGVAGIDGADYYEAFMGGVTEAMDEGPLS